MELILFKWAIQVDPVRLFYLPHYMYGAHTNELKNLKTRWFKMNFFWKKNFSLKTMPVPQYDIQSSHDKCCNLNSVNQRYWL